MKLQDLEAEISSLSPAEKARIIQVLALEVAGISPGVEKTSGVAGGSACIVRTRIPVWVLEGYRRLGWNEARILENFPSLRAADVVNAWAYVDTHQKEIEEEIVRNEEA